MERIKHWWSNWGDEVFQLFASFGVLSLIFVVVILFFGADAIPFDLSVIQRIVITYFKLACFNVMAWVSTWFYMKKLSVNAFKAAEVEPWETSRVYFLFLGALVLLSFT